MKIFFTEHNGEHYVIRATDRADAIRLVNAWMDDVNYDKYDLALKESDYIEEFECEGPSEILVEGSC